MIQIREAVIVEGKYDKIKLESVLDTLILETKGFALFKDKERLALIRRIAEARGIVVLTDSDSAGFVIRRYISGSVPADRIKHAYIPDLFGKERRKTAPSKEGKIGVEGMPAEVLKTALARAGVKMEESEGASRAMNRPITHTDLFEDGLMGGPSSKTKRRALLSSLELPEYLSTHALVQVLNLLFTSDEYKEAVKTLHKYSQ